MSPYFSWLKHLSFFNYALEALLVNEMLYLQLVEERFGLNIDVSGKIRILFFCHVNALSRFLERPSYPPLALMQRITGQMLSSSVQCSYPLFSLRYYGSFSL